MSCAPSFVAVQAAPWRKTAIASTLGAVKTGYGTVTDIVLVHSSDLHVDNDPTQGPYGEDGTTGLRVVLEAAKAHDADFVVLVGDVFDNNRQPAHILTRSAELLADSGRKVVILPGNHDPVTPDSVY